jgi:hypothetical protein
MYPRKYKESWYHENIDKRITSKDVCSTFPAWEKFRTV